MKADADAAADEDEESDDEEEAMDLSEVQEKLESCSEAELKKMLKDMELPVAGKVGAPCTLDHCIGSGTALNTALGNAAIAPHASHHSRSRTCQPASPLDEMHQRRRAERGAGRAHHGADEGASAGSGGGGGGGGVR